MHINKDNYVIKDNDVSIKVTNIEDVFLQKFDITWANFDLEVNVPNSPLTEKDLQHKIESRTWDRVPGENFQCDHKKCDNKIIYKYNNEYFRCDDFKNKHDGLHILFAGCSETEGVGGSLENTWTKKVYEEIKKIHEVSGFYSIARAGYGWQKIITNFQVYTKRYGFPDFLFVMLPNLGRQYKYMQETGTYRYYQLYPENYSISDSGICTTSNNEKIFSTNIYQDGIILLEDYYKALLDFKISWELFEKFCQLNGTTILWSTYELIDSKNFEQLSVGNNFFSIDVENINDYINNKKDFVINKDSFQYRDGHFGSAIKEYWAEMFLNEIKDRGMIEI